MFAAFFKIPLKLRISEGKTVFLGSLDSFPSNNYSINSV